MKKLLLPGTVEPIDTEQVVMVVGANGSGKTRIGTWIELDSPQRDKVHRIVAQKTLSFPNTSSPKSVGKAQNDLLYGRDSWSRSHKNQKYGNRPATVHLNDYQKLLSYLFSEHIEVCTKYKHECTGTKDRVDPPLSKLDRVKDIWDSILPHRKLSINGLDIGVLVPSNDEKGYSASEMSDGERVAFYLIGQCLSAPADGIIVVDEPELHLHKTIQVPLWNAMEKLRDDCLFVYLTHDVHFAAAKSTSKKIWLKSFDGSDWEWEEVGDDIKLPDALLLEVLGSRKPILFVEGESNSFDLSLYRELLPDFLIIPRGSCEQVIQSVKAFRMNPQLHHLEVYGLIDRDRRVEAEIRSLEKSSIYVLEVSEVENLFCVPEILAIVSSVLDHDAEEDFQNISTEVFNKLRSELENQVSMRVSSEVKFKLNNFDISKEGEGAISAALDSLFSDIDVNAIYKDTYEQFADVLQKHDYRQLLALYNRKSLSSQISGILDLANGALPRTVVRLAKGRNRHSIINALKPYFGSFQKHLM